MRRHLFAAVALTLGLSAGAFAQGGGIGGGTGIGGGGIGGGAGIGGGSGGFGGGSGGFGGGTGLSGGTAFGGGSGGMGLTGGTGFGGGTGGAGGRAGGIGGGAGGSGAFQMSAQNPFTSWYASPLYYGRPGATSTTMGQPGQQLKGAGFGQPSFGNVTAARTGTTGTTGLGGRGGTATVNRGMTGGLGGANNQMPEVSYAATVRFPAPPLAVTAVRADLQGLLDRSSALSRPGRVRVEADGNVIVLRGRVADEDEKRLVEGMVRLEPGVQAVRNELEVGP